MWNTEKCLNSDSGPLANMSRWPAGLMLYPAASPCTAREPQQTCLDIPQLTWPIILSQVPNTIGRVGGIFTLRNNCLNHRILEAKFELPKVNGHRFLRDLSLASSSQKVTENADLSLKPKKQAPHWSNWKPANCQCNEQPDWCTRLEGQLFDDVVLSQRGNPSKDRNTDMTKTWAIDRGPLTPPERNQKEHSQKGWTS